MQELCKGVCIYMYSSLSKFIRPSISILTLLLAFGGNLRGQVLNVTQASVLQGFEGKAPNLTGATAVYVQGNYAYVIGTGNMLQILDITLPGLPVPKGILYHGTGGASILRAQNIVVRGNYAYITSYGADAFEIVDVSDPSKPVHKAALYDGNGSAPYLKGPQDLQIVGDYAYVTSANSQAFEIIDISNPSNPRHAGSLLSGAAGSAPFLFLPISVFIKDNLAYIGNLGGNVFGESKLQIVDISNPALPTPKGDLSLGNSQFPFYSYPYGIAVAGNYAYVTDWANGALETIDISNPAIPVHASMLVNANPNVTTPVFRNPPYLYGAWAIEIAGNYAYISLNTNFFFDPTNVIKNEFGSGLVVVDISNPAVPVHAGFGAFSSAARSCREIHVVGDKVYMPGRTKGSLITVSITEPTLPKILSIANSGPGGAIIDFPSAVLVDGNFAYIGNRAENRTDGPGAFEIVNVSDPTRPVHEGSIDDVGSVTTIKGTAALSKRGNFVYLVGESDLYHSIQVIDVTIPSLPVKRGFLRTPQTNPTFPIVGVKAISTSPSNLAFVASGRYKDFDGIVKQGSNSIAQINLFDTNAPTFEQALVDGGGNAPYLNDPSSIASLHPAEGFLYVASTGSNALEVVRITSTLIHGGALLDGGGAAPYLNQPVSVVVQGNYAYVASAGSKALEIVNITNRTNPVHAGAFLDGQQGVSLEGINTVTVSGNYAYITTSVFVLGFPSSKPASLVVLDISNPAAPVHVDTFFDREGGAILDNPTSLFISGPYAYMTNAGLSQNLNIAYLFGPKITNIQPASAPVGSSVTVTGENFNTFLTATVNGTPAIITNVTATTLTFTVPPGATNGKIGLTLNGQTISSTDNFIVTPTTAAATTVQQTSIVANWSEVGAAGYFFDLSTDNFNTFVTDYSNRTVGNVTSLPISSLNSGTSYQYRVRSSDGTTISSNSNIINALTIPATPVTSAATDVTQTSFKINWSPVAGATNYRLDVAADEGFTQYLTGLENLLVSSVSQTISVSSPGTTYYYRLRAVNASGTSPSSNFNLVQTISANPVATPATLTTSSGFTANWSASVGASDYSLDVSTDDFITYVAGYNNLSVGNTTSRSVTGLSAGTSYQYRVRAANAYGSSGSSNHTSVVTLSAATIANDATSVTQSSFGVSWLPVTGATSYSVDVATDNGFLALLYNNVNIGNLTNYTAASLGSNTKYYFRVRANNASGTSANSNIITATTLSSLPTSQSNGLTFSEVSGTSLTLNFIPGNGASHLVVINANTPLSTLPTNGISYAAAPVLGASAALGSGFVVGTGAGPITITGLSSATTYYFHVYDFNGSGGSENYLTTASATNPSAKSTLATIPSNQPTNLTFTNVLASSVTVSFTGSSSNPNGYLVLRTPGSVPPSSPLSGTPYPIGAVLGNSTVAYAGPSLSFFDGGLPTSATYTYRAYSYNGSEAAISYLIANPLQGSVTLDVESPSIGISNTNPSTITSGNTPVFSTIITDNVGISSAKIFYRGISQKTFNSALLSASGTAGSYSVQIQTNWYDSLGMEYYFWAVDQSGNETVRPTSTYFAQLITSFNIPSLPSGEEQGSYGIISFPYQLATGNKVTNVYPGVPWNDNTKAAMWLWDPTLKDGSGDYSQYGNGNAFETVDPGKGYWAIVSTPASPQLSNVIAPKYNQSNLFSMTLKPRWNQVGNPYPVPISWDEVIAYNQNANPNAVFSPLNKYDGKGYKEAKELKAFEGGFVKNLGSTDITIQIPFPGQTGNGGRKATIATDISQDNWNIFLHINQNDRTNQLGGFGMHRLAQSGIDRYDNFNPPAFLDIPQVSFTNAEYPGTTFSNDMVNSQDDYTWTFAPGGRIGKSTQLVWNLPLTSASSKQLLLLDEELLHVIDMSSVTQYDFVLTSNSRFRIFYGSDVKVTTSRIIAGSPFPNPLTNEGKTTINLALPESGSDYAINMQIYNGQGGVIGSLNKRLSPGIHPLEFTLSDSLQEGIYIYKLAVINEKTSSVYTGKIVKP